MESVLFAHDDAYICSRHIYVSVTRAIDITDRNVSVSRKISYRLNDR